MSLIDRSQANAFAVLVLIGFGVLAALYAANTPAFEPPDELAHFLYAHHIAEGDGLPRLDESRSAVFISQATHRHHPPLYYLIGAGLIAPFSRDDLDAHRRVNSFASIGTVSPNNQNAFLHPPEPDGSTSAALWMLRGFGVLLGMGTLWGVYRTGVALTGLHRVGLLAMALTACIPTFIFISASANNDNLVTFLYTMGVLWTVTAWKRRELRGRGAVVIGLILGAMALTKVNGLSLFGIVYAVLMVGAWRGRWSWRAAARTLAVSAGIALIVGGWWYARNLQLYGDPLALSASAAIWGRGDAPQLAEAAGVWLSFWAVLGQFNIQAPDWTFTHAAFLTGFGLAGAAFATWRDRRDHDGAALILWAVVALVIASLIVTTTRVNISQGRLLYPMLGAFSVLIMWGVWRIFRELPSVVLLIPLMIAAMTTPTALLQTAYRGLTALDALPETAHRIDASAGDFTLLGYGFRPNAARDGDVIHVDAYFRVDATPADDYALSVAALDPVTGDVRGTVTTFAGMARTSALSPALYHAVVAFRLSADEDTPPRRLHFEFKWQTVDQPTIIDPPAFGDPLAWHDGDGNALGSSLLVAGVVLRRPDYAPLDVTTPADVRFGDLIALRGYTLDVDAAALTVTLKWDALAAISDDWTLTVQVFDADDNPITQADAPVAGYPTSAWVSGVPFTEARTLPLDAPLPAGYRVAVGWYRGDVRLSVPGGWFDLYVLD